MKKLNSRREDEEDAFNSSKESANNVEPLTNKRLVESKLRESVTIISLVINGWWWW